MNRQHLYKARRVSDYRNRQPELITVPVAHRWASLMNPDGVDLEDVARQTFSSWVTTNPDELAAIRLGAITFTAGCRSHVAGRVGIWDAETGGNLLYSYLVPQARLSPGGTYVAPPVMVTCD